MWTYTELPVYDADAGVRPWVRIRFDDMGGAHDEVVDIRF